MGWRQAVLAPRPHPQRGVTGDTNEQYGSVRQDCELGRPHYSTDEHKNLVRGASFGQRAASGGRSGCVAVCVGGRQDTEGEGGGCRRFVVVGAHASLSVDTVTMIWRLQVLVLQSVVICTDVGVLSSLVYCT